MPIDLPPTPKLWVPPKPAIIRPAPDIRVPPMLGITMLARMSMARSKFVAAGGVTPHSNLTFRTANGSTNVTTSTTYSSQNLGSAAADNWVIGAIMQDGGGSVTSVTIGGVSASLVVSETSAVPRTFIYAANVPAGGTGSIVVNFSGGSQNISCSHWTVNMSSGTATDTSSDSGGAGVAALAGVVIPADGFCLAIAAVDDSAGSWSNDQSFTERLDGLSGGRTVCAAEKSGSFSGTVTFTHTASEIVSAVSASWQ